MPLFGACVICEQEKEGKKYRRVTSDSKEKAEKGGYFKLEVDDLICSDCYNAKVQYDRGGKYPRYPMINEQRPYKKYKSLENIKITNSKENPTSSSIKELQTQILTLKRELEAASRPSSEDVMGNNYMFDIYDKDMEKLLFERKITNLYFKYLDIFKFGRFFNDQIKRLTSILYKEKDIINDPNKFVQMIEGKDSGLKGFFDMLYESMEPMSKNSSTRDNLKRKVMILCYQMAGLRNKHVNLAKKQIALHMSNSGTSVSGINTLSNLGFTTTYKTLAREKVKMVKDYEKKLEEYLNEKVCSWYRI